MIQMDNDCTYHQDGGCLKGLPGTKCERIGCHAYYPETPDCEYYDEQWGFCHRNRDFREMCDFESDFMNCSYHKQPDQ